MSDTSIASPEGRRERKKRDTRLALKRAALTLAIDKGVEHLTIDEITEAADVSERTFFNYFACKEDALIGETAEVSAEVRAAILARPAGEAPLTTLRFAIGQSRLLHEAQENRERALSRQQLIHNHPALLARQLSQAAAFEAALTDAMAVRMQTDSGEDLTPQLLAALAGTVLRVALRRWATEGNRLDDLIDEVFARLSTHLDESAST